VKKPRSDSKLASLTDAQRNTLRDWLAGIHGQASYDEIAARVREQFGLSTSTTALCNYYQLHVMPWELARARGVADDFAKLADGNFNEATRKRVQQLAFEVAAAPRPDIDALSALSKILGDTAKLKLQEQKLSQDARRVRLLETKAAQAAMEQAKKIRAIASDPALDATRKTERVRKLLFGERPGDFAPVTEKGAEQS